MARATPAITIIANAKIGFELRDYVYDGTVDAIGLAAAAALDEVPARVYKTLVIDADDQPICAVLACDREVSMKRLAAASGAKSAKMMPVPAAERLTGYKVGGISPFGQRKPLPTFVDIAALSEPYCYVNGGRRGLQVRLNPADMISILAATVAAFAA